VQSDRLAVLDELEMKAAPVLTAWHRDPVIWEPLSSCPPGIAEGLGSCQGQPAKNCHGTG